jgi:hypothetical protein
MKDYYINNSLWFNLQLFTNVLDSVKYKHLLIIIKKIHENYKNFDNKIIYFYKINHIKEELSKLIIYCSINSGPIKKIIMFYTVLWYL